MSQGVAKYRLAEKLRRQVNRNIPATPHQG